MKQSCRMKSMEASCINARELSQRVHSVIGVSDVTRTHGDT